MSSSLHNVRVSGDTSWQPWGDVVRKWGRQSGYSLPTRTQQQGSHRPFSTRLVEGSGVRRTTHEWGSIFRKRPITFWPQRPYVSFALLTRSVDLAICCR